MKLRGRSFKYSAKFDFSQVKCSETVFCVETFAEMDSCLIRKTSSRLKKKKKKHLHTRISAANSPVPEEVDGNCVRQERNRENYAAGHSNQINLKKIGLHVLFISSCLFSVILVRN